MRIFGADYATIRVGLFVAFGLTALLFFQQDTPAPWGGWQYLLALSPVAFTAPDSFNIARYLVGKGVALTAFAATTSAWFLITGEPRVAAQVWLLVWVTAWLSLTGTVISVRLLVRLFWSLVIIGAVVMHLVGWNMWGFLPSQTYGMEEGLERWRVSIFPNISSTAPFCLIVIVAITASMQTARRYWHTALAASYFLFLSFSRTTIVALLIYGAVRLMLHLAQKRGRPAVAGVTVVASITSPALVLIAIYVAYYMSSITFFADVFLRGETGLNMNEIWAQAHRPWLWWQHLSIFAHSPWLMGEGQFDFSTFVATDISGMRSTGSESYPTRMLASYGLPAFLYFGFICWRAGARISEIDLWACAVAPATLFVMFNYGSIFHPTSPLYALFLLPILHGRGILGDAA